MEPPTISNVPWSKFGCNKEPSLHKILLLIIILSSLVQDAACGPTHRPCMSMKLEKKQASQLDVCAPELKIVTS